MKDLQAKAELELRRRENDRYHDTFEGHRARLAYEIEKMKREIACQLSIAMPSSFTEVLADLNKSIISRSLINPLQPLHHNDGGTTAMGNNNTWTNKEFRKEISIQDMIERTFNVRFTGMHQLQQIIEVVLIDGALEVIYRHRDMMRGGSQVFKEIYGAYKGGVKLVERVDGHFRAAEVRPAEYRFPGDSGAKRVPGSLQITEKDAINHYGVTKKIESVKIVDGTIEVTIRETSPGHCIWGLGSTFDPVTNQNVKIYKDVYAPFQGGLRKMETILAKITPSKEVPAKTEPEKIEWPTTVGGASSR
jgi:hypothetical protein